MRVLIHSNRDELDRNLEPVDYNKLPSLKKKWGGNIGNKLFLTAIDVYCHAQGIEYQYLTSNMTADYVNENFDLILWPLANCFAASKETMGYLENYIDRLKLYKKPVLALGAGAQANSYDELNTLFDCIKNISCRFIDAVHATGGIFGLRGYFTMDLFKKFGYNEDFVIGCPSMFQMGRNLRINKTTLSECTLRLALNGDKETLKTYSKNKLYDKYPQSWFIDQGDYVFLLYDNKKKMNFLKVRSLMKEYSKMGIQMLSDARILCIYDLPRLAQQLYDLKINFSFGQRIHGNILATLLGIPAVVYTHDSRTQELAEFFSIPTFSGKLDGIDLLDIYEAADWTKFNASFPDKYDNFEKLLTDYGMPKISRNQYTFLTDAEKYKLPKTNDYSDIKSRSKFLWIGID